MKLCVKKIKEINDLIEANTLYENITACLEFPNNPGVGDLELSENVMILTLASVTLNSLRMYWGMLYSAMGSTTKY